MLGDHSCRRRVALADLDSSPPEGGISAALDSATSPPRGSTTGSDTTKKFDGIAAPSTSLKTTTLTTTVEARQGWANWGCSTCIRRKSPWFSTSLYATLLILIIYQVFVLGRIMGSLIHSIQLGSDVWTPPDRYHIIHSVLTRFMVEQADQTTLAQARLKLFKTFCHPTMTHQTSQNYYWVVLVDPGLDGLIIQEIKSLLDNNNVYMVMTNNTMWMQDGTNKERKTAAYGVSLNTIATEWSRGNLDVITGNKAHLTRTLEWYNDRKMHENLIIIETLLDADDGMHHEGIAGIQEFAVEHTHMILQQNQEQQKRQQTRTNHTVKTESSSSSSSLIRDWWILSGTDHIEWHNSDVYTLKRDEYKKVGITSGVVGIRLKPKECVSAGYTRIGLVTENIKETTESRSSKVARYDFPLAASQNHFIATRDYPPCTSNMVTYCYHRFFVEKPLTVRARTITSDGMTHLDPKTNSYNMKSANKSDTEFETFKGEEVWRLLQHEFFIDRYEAYQTSIYLFKRRIDILAENEQGQCIPGFPCNKSTTNIHESLKIAINDGSGRLLDTRIQAKSHLVLMTAVFGVSPLPAYFPMFLRSIQASGADGIVIGGDEMELKDTLPPNIRHIPMTWNGLHDLISHKLFGGTPLPGFQAAHGYKVINVKPLYGFLFRKFIQDYEFWAHVDNDMIFGNVARLMNPMMDQFDVISALGRGQADCGLKNPCKITHGPFTAYRNVPEITELFRFIEGNLYEGLNTTQAYAVDEWGGLRKRLGTNNAGSNDYLRSMSHVIHKYRNTLPIRVGGSVPFACAYFSKNACDCVWTTSNGTSSHLNVNGRDVMFCHFMQTKHIAAKRLLEIPKNDQEAILHATSVMWSKEHGISIVDDGKGGGDKLDPEKNLGTKSQGNAMSSLPVDDHHANSTAVLDQSDSIFKRKGWDNDPVVLEPYKLIFFTVPKVACTKWKTLFRRMMGHLDWDTEQPHNPATNGLRYLGHYPPRLQIEFMTSANWTRAIFVRDPLERLLSAYLDKGLEHKDYILRNCCQRNMRNQPYQQQCKVLKGISNNHTSLPKMEEFTFEKFVKTYMKQCKDPHWLPQSNRMNPSNWDFINFVGHFDSLAQDAQSLLKRVGAWESFGFDGWGVYQNRSFLENNDAKHATSSHTRIRKFFTPEIKRLALDYLQADYDLAVLNLERP